jgi:serine/threonine-protein kinase
VEGHVPVKWGIYTLEQALGRGGMAVVWAASKERPGQFKRDVCIKQILPHLSHDPKFVEMFRQEASVAASLRHPNIVAVTDFDSVEGQLFLEMELIDGIDLHRLLRRVRQLGLTVPLGFARHVTASLLAALAHAHGRVERGEPAPVIHRDVSPANVLISEEGEVKLADFGIAKVRGSAVQTEVGWVKGKFSYLSPEQAHGHEVDPRSDLYSAGLVLHELLTGRRFNRGKGQSEEMGHPDDRFATADQALTALKQIRLEEPYDSAEAGRLVERVRELPAAKGRPQPDEDAVTHYAGDDLPTAIHDDESARASPHGTPTPLADARTVVDRSRRGGTTWLKVALAVAVAAVLFLLARELLDRAAGEEPAEDPGSPVVEPPDEGVAPAAVAAAPAAPADTGAAPAAAAAEPDAGRDAPPPPAAVQSPGFGRLEVNCRPWARVWVDGRDVGTTPIKDLKVRAGKRRVTLQNEKLGYKRTFFVKVPKGGKGSLSKDITAAEPATEP